MDYTAEIHTWSAREIRLYPYPKTREGFQLQHWYIIHYSTLLHIQKSSSRTRLRSNFVAVRVLNCLEKNCTHLCLITSYMETNSQFVYSCYLCVFSSWKNKLSKLKRNETLLHQGFNAFEIKVLLRIHERFLEYIYPRNCFISVPESRAEGKYTMSTRKTLQLCKRYELFADWRLGKYLSSLTRMFAGHWGLTRSSYHWVFRLEFWKMNCVYFQKFQNQTNPFHDEKSAENQLFLTVSNIYLTQFIAIKWMLRTSFTKFGLGRFFRETCHLCIFLTSPLLGKLVVWPFSLYPERWVFSRVPPTPAEKYPLDSCLRRCRSRQKVSDAKRMHVAKPWVI